MKRIAILAVTLVSLACLTSCTGMISAASVDPLIRTVSDRHDAYVNGDQSLSQVQRETYLRSTTLLRKLLDEAAAGPVE
jgi:hypothetical protein